MTDKTSRRNFMKAITIGSLALPYFSANSAEASPDEAPGTTHRPGKVEQWGVYETALKSRSKYSNPFTDVTLKAHFRCDSTELTVNGFYDGEDTWRIRLMPTAEGQWTYVTESNVHDLDGKKGSFECVGPGPGNHGPVHMAKKVQFSYADGTPFPPLGTTLYNWVHRDR